MLEDDVVEVVLFTSMTSVLFPFPTGQADMMLGILVRDLGFKEPFNAQRNKE